MAQLIDDRSTIHIPSVDPMNTEPVRFLEPVTFTDLSPRALSAECEAWLTEYKEAFLAGLKGELGTSLSPEWIQHALREADSLASLTPVPSLFWPELATEKLAAAQAWQERQNQLLGGPEITLTA